MSDDSEHQFTFQGNVATHLDTCWCHEPDQVEPAAPPVSAALWVQAVDEARNRNKKLRATDPDPDEDAWWQR